MTKEFKGNIIDFLAESTETCSDVRKMRHGKRCEFKFDEQECKKCEEANKKWLLKEKHDFDFEVV